MGQGNRQLFVYRVIHALRLSASGDVALKFERGPVAGPEARGRLARHQILGALIEDFGPGGGLAALVFG
jgi:hypothetical protein